VIILGVDPGTLVTGYGVISVVRNSCTLLDFDVITNRNERSMPLRLKEIYSRLCGVIAKFHPDEFAIETAFYGKNAQSALKIGQARGVSILAAVNHEIPTAEYSPREIKKAVVGNGAASKEQVEFMVKSVLKIREAPRLLDATDALAVALCHFHRISGNHVGSTTTTNQKNWSSYVKNNPHRLRKPQ
jgi:crossover junction endodeoxyribonuclease RuvC